MENFISIGELLRTAREEKKYSLEDVSRKTKININILRSLEANDLANLPNIAYVRGFVKSYARFVKVEQNSAAEALNATFKINEPAIETIVNQKVELEQQDEENRKEEIQESIISIVQSFFNKNIMIAIGALIIVVIIINALVNWFADLNFERKEITEAKQAVSSKVVENKTAISPLKDQDKNILVMEASKKFSQQLANDQAEQIDKNTQEDSTKQKIEAPKKETIKEVVEKKPELPKEVAKVETKEEEARVEELDKSLDGKFPYQKFYAAPLNMYTMANDVSSEVNALLPSHIRAAYKEGSQSVYIIADSGETWISYQTDGGVIKRYVLRQGRRLYLNGSEILVFLGNYRATKIFYNTKLIEVNPTKSGVKSLIFPPDNAKEHYLPLFPVYKNKSYSAKEYRENMQSSEDS